MDVSATIIQILHLFLLHILAYFSSDEIDSIISEYLFKLAEQDPAQARKDTMLGFVELR